jgi:alpha/beta superfamily hydrolase
MSVIIHDRRPTSALLLITAWTLAVITFLYMLPWAIALTRGKANAGAIGWLNLLLGWSFVGWVAALVMACMAHQAVAVSDSWVAERGPRQPWAPQPNPEDDYPIGGTPEQRMHWHDRGVEQ